MKILRIIGRGVLLLVGALVAAYLLKGVVGSIELVRTKAQVRADIRHGLRAGANGATDGQQQLRRQLREHGAPTYSWQELSCDFSSRDAGWFPQAYLQDCEVRAVDLYATSSPTTGTTCTDIPTTPRVGTADRIATVRIGSTDALTAADRHWDCPPGLTQPRPFRATKVVSGSRPEDLSTSPAWIVAETTTDVSSTEIGCSPWGVIFCNQPYDEPVLP